ncbi:hypothetical protein [Pseudomonas sp. ACM7]|uniref:hypothetical protein n=1 Tax=Pseudomonas sp. ACM7 TaxID=2052956 RepID=UPI001011FC63|nr:hypothetical protein [Pseudomonas sp. ACM7]QAY91484.1 hypothetical protein CUN63_16810 [Pseudomonas sp. ACM7]
MDYAYNKLTNKVESADQATGFDLYTCPCCKAMMSHRAGTIRKKYFAHWPGWGTPECENFSPGQQTQNTQSGVFTALTKRRMDLRLIIPKEQGRTGWYFELVLPSCRACDATVTVDVGGRLQPINMRGMTDGFRVMAELSTENFRIVSFDGDPDPFFKGSVERECLGFPSFGAAAFTASGRGETRGFPRAQELRGSETYALLWKEPATPDFPNELVLDWLVGRQGWHHALVTLPDRPSSECSQWLQSFTGLIVHPPVPYIIPIWPFLTRNSSIHTIECAESSVVLLSAHMMPMGLQDQGPTMQAFGGSDRLSATGVDRSPAFFALTPERIEYFRVGKNEYQDLQRVFTRSPSLGRNQRIPAVEVIFKGLDGACLVVPIHQKRCKTLLAAVRAQELSLEYLAMPPGTEGQLITERRSERCEVNLSAGVAPASHNQHQRLLPLEVQASVICYLTDPECRIDLNFSGFGRLRLYGEQSSPVAEKTLLTLGPSLRARVHSYMCQLQVSTPMLESADDHSLVRAFSVVRPQPELIPHHRTLATKILACGFELNI